MKKYYVYKMNKSNTIKTYLATDEKDIERVDTLLQETAVYTTIYTFTDEHSADLLFEFVRVAVNKILAELGVGVRYEKDDMSTETSACWKLCLTNDLFMDSYILNMNNDFYYFIEDILYTFKFKPSYNNTRSYIFVRFKEEK